MECGIFRKHLNENDCSDIALPGRIQNHLAGCQDCQKYFRFVSALNLQKGSLEKAPRDILPNIEKKISESVRQIKNQEPFEIFALILKPSFAASFAAAALLLFFYAYMAGNSVGYVENLSERFKLAQFENIKPGDMLYAGDNTIAAISLKSGNRFQIHKNTVVRVESSRQIVLSRGEVSIFSGNRGIQVKIPQGFLLAKNADMKIHTTASMENGLLKTETTCAVLKGEITVKTASGEMILVHGQKAVLAGNGETTYQNRLTAAEIESERSISVSRKVFSAVQALCDCIYSSEYAPDKKKSHLQFFGKEADENKFRVRVFWPEKELNEPGFGPSAEKNKTGFTGKRRHDV